MHVPFATITLIEPVKFSAAADPVSVLELKPNGRALQNLTIPMGQGEHELKMMFVKPWDLALVGLIMAGQQGGAAFLGKMDPRDIWSLANAVLGFILGEESPKDGSTESAS